MAAVTGVDITPNHLLIRGDHLPDHPRTGAHADAIERALDGVEEAVATARADRNLTPDGVREKQAEAATAALEEVEGRTATLVEVLEREQEQAGGSPFALTALPGVDPTEAAAQRRHALTLFLDTLKEQPEDKRDAWLRSRLMDAVTNDRKLLLGAVYELAADLGDGAYGVTGELLAEVQEAHFRTLAPDKAEVRDQRLAAAQLVRANAANATRRLREMGASGPGVAL